MSTDDVSAALIIHKDEQAERNSRKPPRKPEKKSKTWMKNVNYVHLTTLNTFNTLKGLFVPARKCHRKGGKGG